MKYWIYESWSHNKAIVHDGACPYCENGTNPQGEKSTTRNGWWTGPYGTADLALKTAVATRRQIIRGCRHCMTGAAAVRAA